MPELSRRALLAATAAMLASALAGCKKKSGPEPVRYDREVCAICNMIISDPRFAAELRTPDGKLVKFDDIGDAIHWMIRQDWYKKGQRAKEIWVMDMRDGKTWLDARKAWYVPGQVTPMDYGFGAVAKREPGAVDYQAMKREVIKRGLSSRCEHVEDLPEPDDSAAASGNDNGKEGGK